MPEKRRGSIAIFLEKFRLRSDSLPGWFPVYGNSTFSSIHKVDEVNPDPFGLRRADGLKEICYDADALEEACEEALDSDAFSPKEFSIVSKKSVDDNRKRLLSKQRGNDALGIVLSALYGKLLVVMGIAFPMSEVISTYIPPSFYDGFYLYLYFGSITFMICVYGNIVRRKATDSVRYTINKLNSIKLRRAKESPDGEIPSVICTKETSAVRSMETTDSDGSCVESPTFTPFSSRRSSGGKLDPFDDERIHFGSFYLRIGAVAFGIGSMIYSGLEFGQYFELVPETKCHNIMIALTPAVRMIFTFGQMYFIFMNSRMAVSTVRLGAQFGLMHMIGTNLCVWLNVLVQETRHEILHFYNPDNHTFQVSSLTNSSSLLPNSLSLALGLEKNVTLFNTNSNLTNYNLLPNLAQNSVNLHHRNKRGLRGPHSIYECRRTDIFGSLVQTSSQFLFPCTIEYSLICAAILYVMWKSICKRQALMTQAIHTGHRKNFRIKRSPHHYSVDCARANKGLFVGIFVFVMTIISLILYFVLTGRPEYRAMATLEVNITELVLYTMTTLVVLIGMCQVRELRFTESRNLELDNILLIVSQTGSIIYNVFTIIAGHFTLRQNTILMLVTAVASLVQLLVQTLFILDASKRCPSNADQARRKPGREIVTFLLVTNLAMWLINTLEKSRADSQTVQLKFYGVWAWTIITQSAMPLAIFYRFHSTVCLCDIWKKAFKLKNR